MNPPADSMPTSLIGKCLRRSGPKQRGKILESYAAEVVIAARILGPRAAGESLGKELFGEQVTVTATPILKVVAMVESSEIPVTKEQLLAVVQQDESALRFYALNPWIIDPSGKSSPPAKKGRKPSNLTKSEMSAPPKSPPSTPIKEPQAKAESSTATPRKPEKPGKGKAAPAKQLRPTAEELREASRLESENQRRPFEGKIADPKPPVFRSSPPPSKDAPEAEREAWRAKKKQELAEFIELARKEGWEIPLDWDGYGSAAKVAKWIGT